MLWNSGGRTLSKTTLSDEIVAPTLTLEIPADLAVDVPVNSAISATFSEQLSPLPVASGNFYAQETGPPQGTELSGTIRYNVSSRVALLEPTDDLLADTNYTVTVLNSVTDTAGNKLEPWLLPNPWTFQTAPASIPIPS